MQQNLLNACLEASGQTGGTIHEFLPRLQWVKQNHEWTLRLDYTKGISGGKLIAYTDDSYKKGELPVIEPEMGRAQCDSPDPRYRQGFSAKGKAVWFKWSER